VAAEKWGYANVLCLQISLKPGFGFGAGRRSVRRAGSVCVGVAAGCRFPWLFEAEGGDFFEHFVDGEMVVDGIEDADGDFAEGACGDGALGFIAGAANGEKSVAGAAVSFVFRQRASDEGRRLVAARN